MNSCQFRNCAISSLIGVVVCLCVKNDVPESARVEVRELTHAEKPCGPLRTFSPLPLDEFFRRESDRPGLSPALIEEAKARGGNELVALALLCAAAGDWPDEWCLANPDWIQAMSPEALDSAASVHFATVSEALRTAVINHSGIPIGHDLAFMIAGEAGTFTRYEFLRLRVVWPLDFGYGSFIEKTRDKKIHDAELSWLLIQAPPPVMHKFLAAHGSPGLTAEVMGAICFRQPDDLADMIGRYASNADPEILLQTLPSSYTHVQDALAKDSIITLLASRSADDETNAPLRSVAAKAAVARIHQKGDLGAVLEEANNIQNDSLRQAYLSSAIETAARWDPAGTSVIVSARPASGDDASAISALLPYLETPALKEAWQRRLSEISDPFRK